MKDDLCRAFCDDVCVTATPLGLAVSTAFRRDDGDRVAFYVVEDGYGMVHLEDDGTTIPDLEEAGVDFETQTRRRALDVLLEGIDGYFDADAVTIRTRSFVRDELASRALAFVGVLLRMNDFLLLTAESVRSTFSEDAARKIKLAIGDKAKIREGEPVNEKLSEANADMVIEVRERAPVAVFFGNSPQRVQDAIFLQMSALYEAKVDLSVIALLETETSIPPSLRRRASNRLATVTEFREDEDAAVSRIVREAIGHAA